MLVKAIALKSMKHDLKRSQCKLHYLQFHSLYFFLQNSTNNQAYKLAMYSFAMLINATSLEMVINHLQNIYFVFGFRYIDDTVQISLKYLNEKFKDLNKEDEQIAVKYAENRRIEVNEWSEEDTDDDDGDEEKAIYTASQIPFLAYIKKRLESCQKLLTTDIQDCQARNENQFYHPCYQ